jgi:hypothetical protein
MFDVLPKARSPQINIEVLKLALTGDPSKVICSFDQRQVSQCRVWN